MQTALAGVLSALAWPIVLVSASSVIDNPWNVMISRSAEVGSELAEVLIQRSQGNRPVTLIGFSLGARVIFHALMALSKKENFRGTPFLINNHFFNL
jgi:thioesterase domain-containing protein